MQHMHSPPSRTLAGLEYGFTLIEMMVTIAIAVILLTLGVPSMKSMIERNAIANQVNAFTGSVIAARSEAIKRNAPVVVCRSDNAETSSSPSCATSGTDWKGGWIVFLDRDDNQKFNASAGDVLLRIQGNFSNSGGIEQNSFNKLQFRNTGLLKNGASQFTFNTISLTANQQRRVCVSFTGRTRLIDNDTDLCND